MYCSPIAYMHFFINMMQSITNAVSLYHAMLQEEVQACDIRHAADFANGFIKGSVYAGAYKDALFLGILKDLLTPELPLVLVASAEAAASEARALFERQGIAVSAILLIDEVPRQCLDMIITIEPDELAMDLPHDAHLVLYDVRNDVRWAEGHLERAAHFPLPQMYDTAQIAMIPEHANIYLYDEDGCSSMTAASIMKLQGIDNLRVVLASWENIAATQGLKTEKDPGKLN